jgi:hypothetical protein
MTMLMAYGTLVLMDYRERQLPSGGIGHGRLPKVKTGRTWRATGHYKEQPERVWQRHGARLTLRVLGRFSGADLSAFRCSSREFSLAFGADTFLRPCLRARFGSKRMVQYIRGRMAEFSGG